MPTPVSRTHDARALLACISRVTEAVTAATDLEEVVASALDGLEEGLGVERSAVLLFDDAGVMRFRAWRGLSDGYRGAVDGHSPWGPAERAPRAIVVADVAKDASLGDLRRAILAEGIGALVFVPLVARGELVGKFMLYYAEPTVPSDGELDLARILAGHVGFAISRLRSESRLRASYEELRVVLDSVQRDEDTRRFLLEASHLLASSLDMDTTLQRIANLAVPQLADWCAIRLYENGELGFPVIAHTDPEKVPLALEMAMRYPPDPGQRGGSWEVIRTGEPVHQPEIPDEMFRVSAKDERHLQLLLSLQIRSYLAVPLRARGQSVGAMTLGHCAARWFGERELELGVQLGDLAGMAVDNARLYRSARVAEQRLAAERERLTVTLRSIGEGVVATDTNGRVVLCNGVAERMTGFRQEEAVGRPLAEVFPIFAQGSGRPVQNPVDVVLRTGQLVGLANHTILRARDGSERAIAHSAAPIRDADDEVLGVVLVFRDVTEQHRLEEELARTSKLESLGVLAGGIAHDFNNLLTVIVGNLSLVERKLPAGPVRERVVAASRACGRARDLTRQLLTFSRGGAPVRAPVAVAPLLREAIGFALQGSRSRAVFDLAADLWPVQADAGQLGQVLHNLALNADQAMPEGGRITVRAENLTVDRPVGVPLAPGRYVRLVVADEGPGVPPDLVHRIFDPFFTTKAQGSGLGLATAHSIVHRHEGHLSVAPATGHGAAFVVHLPAAEEEPVEDDPTAEHALPRGRGRVLVMDDDEHVRALAFECLRVLGYAPEVVPDGEQAVARWIEAREAGDPFELAIVDLTVPGGMGGREAIARIQAVEPGARAVVASGYCNDPVMARYHEHGFVGVIQKPWSLEDLARVLRDVLEPTS